ncbi:hypothetical protein CEUSTIGMA_g7887.t1 [Chlamydomonas eustigma]|uniref:BZIP domain-containing protein n=1 Tax=Chlamydomonas eustigma TaxID=1157962 RepID=A0A250XBJ5_9CHLO|nr:hypothetical protein CEUSTIGMA_g7887.t1 [Chlamydomonas eustigma]|eukprot:GAX80448.1 hypothetical protein CEUSTIGMA_g7887.t1 [Chlamydomonas eustigma]
MNNQAVQAEESHLRQFKIHKYAPCNEQQHEDKQYNGSNGSGDGAAYVTAMSQQPQQLHVLHEYSSKQYNGSADGAAYVTAMSQSLGGTTHAGLAGGTTHYSAGRCSFGFSSSRGSRGQVVIDESALVPASSHRLPGSAIGKSRDPLFNASENTTTVLASAPLLQPKELLASSKPPLNLLQVLQVPAHFMRTLQSVLPNDPAVMAAAAATSATIRQQTQQQQFTPPPSTSFLYRPVVVQASNYSNCYGNLQQLCPASKQLHPGNCSLAAAAAAGAIMIPAPALPLVATFRPHYFSSTNNPASADRPAATAAPSFSGAGETEAEVTEVKRSFYCGPVEPDIPSSSSSKGAEGEMTGGSSVVAAAGDYYGNQKRIPRKDTNGSVVAVHHRTVKRTAMAAELAGLPAAAAGGVGSVGGHCKEARLALNDTRAAESIIAGRYALAVAAALAASAGTAEAEAEAAIAAGAAQAVAGRGAEKTAAAGDAHYNAAVMGTATALQVMMRPAIEVSCYQPAGSTVPAGMESSRKPFYAVITGQHPGPSSAAAGQQDPAVEVANNNRKRNLRNREAAAKQRIRRRQMKTTIKGLVLEIQELQASLESVEEQLEESEKEKENLRSQLEWIQRIIVQAQNPNVSAADAAI